MLSDLSQYKCDTMTKYLYTLEYKNIYLRELHLPFNIENEK